MDCSGYGSYCTFNKGFELVQRTFDRKNKTVIKNWIHTNRGKFNKNM